MKNRRITIVAFLLIAALTLGFGYAAVSNVLDIQGSAKVDGKVAVEEFQEDIYFAGVVLGDEVKDSIDATAGQNYTANININNNDKGSFTVNGLRSAGEKAVMTFRIANKSLHEVTVALKANESFTNSNKTYFSFDYYFGTEDVKTGTIAKSNGTTATYLDVTVVVELIDQPTKEETASFLIELLASAGE